MLKQRAKHSIVMKKLETRNITAQDHEVITDVHEKMIGRGNKDSFWYYCDDSFWYYGKHIATISKGAKKLIIEATGELVVQFEEDGEIFEGHFAVTEATKRGYNDSNLQDGHADVIFSSNNWFRIISPDDETGESEVIASSYSEAIKKAQELI